MRALFAVLSVAGFVSAVGNAGAADAVLTLSSGSQTSRFNAAQLLDSVDLRASAGREP